MHYGCFFKTGLPRLSMVQDQTLVSHSGLSIKSSLRLWS